MEYLSNYHEVHPNQHKNGHNPSNEIGHPVLGLLGSQWELRKHDQNKPMEVKPLDHKY